MNKRVIAVLAVVCLLLAGCGQQEGASVTTVSGELTSLSARELIKRGEDMLWQYHGEMALDDSAGTYSDEAGRMYRASRTYTSVDSLKKATEAVLSKGFCENVLYSQAFDPQKPKFIEREDRLWETRSVGGMGWVIALLPETVQVVSQDSESAVVMAYAQSLVEGVFREEFAFVYEDGGWRMDSYFKMNRAGDAVVLGPTLADYLRGEDEGGFTGNVTIKTARSTVVELTEQRLCEPVYDILEALEYDTQSTEGNAEWPAKLNDGDGIELELLVGDTTKQLVMFKNGDVFARDAGKPATSLRMSYPSGYSIMEILVSTARWELFNNGDE